MTASTVPSPTLVSRLVSGLLAIKPVAEFAKRQARQMMIDRAEAIGVPWLKTVAELRSRDLEAELAQVSDPNLTYPDYYLRPFHAYDRGNLSWEAATEVEVAAYAVHARVWPDGGAEGDARLRRSYHDALVPQLDRAPQAMVDLGCSVGMSTFALQDTFPNAQVTGVDLSPYFLAIARQRSQEQGRSVQWVHAAAESTGLPAAAFDLVSACLMFHELPQEPSQTILREARRLLRPGGHLAIMDMNPRSAVYAKMPPYILTLLKSTEPYLDEYFAFDLEGAIVAAGFEPPTVTENSPRHRTVVAKAK